MEQNILEVTLQSTTHSQNTTECDNEEENNKISQIDVLQLTMPSTEEFLTVEETKEVIKLKEIDDILEKGRLVKFSIIYNWVIIASIGLFFSPFMVIDILYRQDILSAIMDFVYCLYFQLQHIFYIVSVQKKDLELAQYALKLIKVKIFITFVTMLISGYKFTDLYSGKHKSDDINDEDIMKILLMIFILSICALASQVLITLPVNIRVSKILRERNETLRKI